MKVDLHIHTIYSDGSFTPEQIVDKAIEIGLDAIALTDHDNILSYKIAQDYIDKKFVTSEKKPLELIQGVEINTIYKGKEIHILGYLMDTKDDDFQQLLETQQKARLEQTLKIVELLNKKAHINVKLEDIKKLVAINGSIGRPHIAKAITIRSGIGSITDAYAKYINDESPIYVQRNTVNPHEAVEIIYEAGGIPVFAHPYDLDNSAELIKELMHCGLRGIEAYHRKHSPAMVEYFSSLAEKLGLIVTGGSDFHSPHPTTGQVILGKNFIPEWVYSQLMEEKKRLNLAK